MVDDTVAYRLKLVVTSESDGNELAKQRDSELSKKGSLIIVSGRGELSDNGRDRMAVKRTCMRTTSMAGTGTGSHLSL